MRECLILRDAAGRWRRDPSAPVMGQDGSRLQNITTSASDLCLTQGTLGRAEVTALARDPHVLAIAPVMPTRLIAPEPVDDLLDRDAVAGWGLDAIGATKRVAKHNTTRMALLDTGIDAEHPAFVGLSLVKRDFVGKGDHDHHGNGTHCAATVLGRRVAGHRIGVAPHLDNLIVAKVMPDFGRGTSGMLFNGLIWALATGAEILMLSGDFDAPFMNLSLVEAGRPEAEAKSIAQRAYYNNVALLRCIMHCSADINPLLIVPAGNDSKRMVAPDYDVGATVLGSVPGVISVGALRSDDRCLSPASFSNSHPTLSAPGVSIISAAADDGLRPLHGTTMAAAHVAGAAALWRGALGKVSYRRTMLSACTTSRFSHGVSADMVGAGLVQVPDPRRLP